MAYRSRFRPVGHCRANAYGARSGSLRQIEWILHRPPHASSPTEIRVAELLRRLADSPPRWIVVWGYYYRDNHGTAREGDFLVLGPAGGLLVLEVKSSLPRHFPGTSRWEGAPGDDPIQQLITEWQGVFRGVQAKGLNSKAVILIGLPPFRDLTSDYDHYSWFMGLSRAKPLLAVVSLNSSIAQK